MLRERLSGRSLRCTDKGRALLARKAFGIPRKLRPDAIGISRIEQPADLRSSCRGMMVTPTGLEPVFSP